MTTINDYLKMSDSELKNISDDTISQMSYGIKYFDFGAAGIKATKRDWQIMEYLRNRLQAIEIKPTAKTGIRAFIECDCGHAVPRKLVMNASLGTSCPDCYDRMSC